MHGGRLHHDEGRSCFAQTLRPIDGLYAAGEITGGVHGMARLGGCSSVECMVYGQIAGHEVAKRVKKA
nr:FAD-binding protein [Sutterella massiliensis]